MDYTCIVEKSFNDALNSLDAFCGERRAVGFLMGELGSFAMDNFAMLVRRELVLGGNGMVILGANIADVSWHGEAA